MRGTGRAGAQVVESRIWDRYGARMSGLKTPAFAVTAGVALAGIAFGVYGCENSSSHQTAPSVQVLSTVDSSKAMTELARVIDTHDAAAVAGLLADKVAIRGLHLADADCGAFAATARVVEGAARDALARCLSRLHPQRITRTFAGRRGLFPVVPGVEYIVGIDPDGKLVSIDSGTSDPQVVAVTPELIERYRTAGAADPPLDPALEKRYRSSTGLGPMGTSVADASFQICLDPAGKFVSVVGSSSEYTAFAESIRTGLADWRFGPVLIDGKPAAVCVRYVFYYPRARAPSVAVLLAPAPPPPSQASVEHAAEAFAAKLAKQDAGAIVQVLGSSIRTGGLLFEGATCRQLFGAFQVVTGNDRLVLARCLTSLRPLPTRHVFVAGKAVMGALAAEPGLEYAVGFDADGKVSAITTPFTADRVAVTSELLEHNRRAGSAAPQPGPRLQARYAGVLEQRASGVLDAAFRVCLDEAGRIEGVDGSPDRDRGTLADRKFADWFRAQIYDWEFTPVQLEGRPTAVCAWYASYYPAAKAPAFDLMPLPPPPVSLPRPADGSRAPSRTVDARKLDDRCNEDKPADCYELGMRLLAGAKDVRTAKRLLAKACAADHEPACALFR